MSENGDRARCQTDHKTSETAGFLSFGVAVSVLLVAIFGWSAASRTLQWHTRKEPMPWPEGVVVNHDTFINESLPMQFGPYRMVSGDGVFQGSMADGKPDGQIEYDENTLEELGIGSTLDRQRVDARKSNWYVTRIYEDTRKNTGSSIRYWMLDVVYYSGGELTVPHVPDECVQAAGATPVGRDVLSLQIKTPGPDWSQWTDGLEFVALRYEKSDAKGLGRYVQYYLFNMCGLPMTSRERVRLGLMDLGRRYVYYAKIQVTPWPGRVDNSDEADSGAREFLTVCIPHVLGQFPSAQAVDQMKDED